MSIDEKVEGAKVMNMKCVGRTPTITELFDKYRRAMRNHEYTGAHEYADMIREHVYGVSELKRWNAYKG